MRIDFFLDQVLIFLTEFADRGRLDPAVVDRVARHPSDLEDF